MNRCLTCGHTWPQPPPDNGGPLDKPTLDALLAAITSSDTRAVVNGWLSQSLKAGESWSPKHKPYVRQFEISRAALELATATDGDDTYARLILSAARNSTDEAGPLPVGRLLGALTIDEARRVCAVAEAFGSTLHLTFTEDGHPRLDGDVAAVLAAA